ncbi:unnamed protein product [Parnassius apollo]|uniref:(apollo) hypothetical protein n=1 Tax=Parnassius apollo TaxID=110799 RepID=A0A8S3X3B3_PARAO|nr:unnamed protein product [Parnassius apollo]
MNYKDCCRTCLGGDKEMRHMHTKISVAGDKVRLSDILVNFYNYKIPEDPLLPVNICINCVHQLTITYSFKILIESSAKTLSESNLLDCSKSENFDYSLESDDQKVIKDIKRRHIKRKVPHKIQNSAKYVNQTKELYCVECKAKFNSVKFLNEHCMNNHPVKNVVGRDCEFCNEKFEDFRSLVLHRKLHLKPFLCENCWEGFYSTNELHSHSCQPNVDIKDKNKSERVLRQCDQCGKAYPPGYIRIHMLTHSNNRPYSCKFCPKKFKVPGGLHSHVLWNHKRTRNYKCEKLLVNLNNQHEEIRAVVGAEHVAEAVQIYEECALGSLLNQVNFGVKFLNNYYGNESSENAVSLLKMTKTHPSLLQRLSMVNEPKPKKKKDVETLLKKQFGDNWMDNQELDWFKNNIFHTSPVAIAETSQINDEDDDHSEDCDCCEPDVGEFV